MPFHTLRLPNGLQVIGETIPTSRSVGVGFYVRTGSRDESPAEMGVSHFLEHMVFKGTPRRSALDVNRDFDRLGANYNAYTSEEQTVYYAAILPEYLPSTVDILADILRPSLRDEDFETEKQVILEEIKKYDDQPQSVAWDRAKEIYFDGHPLGNSILGTNASVSALTSRQMRAYFDRRYVNSNIVVAAAGNFDWPTFVELIAEQTASWPNAEAPRGNLRPARGPGGIHSFPKGGLTQQHLLAMAPGCSAEDPLRYTSSVLANAIGDDSSSRFHWELVDPGKVESAGFAGDQSQASGFVAAMISGAPEATAENWGIARRVLDEIQKNGLEADEIHQAKTKIASRIVRAAERPMGRMRSIADSWIYCGEYADPDVELARFDAVSADSIREYLERFPITDMTVVSYGPLEQFGV